MKRLPLLFFLSLFITTFAIAQDNANDEWDVTTHMADYDELSFTTDEGTWMNLDVSPDGSEIVFDLLGNIYIMPIEGGEATVLRESPPPPGSAPMAITSPLQVMPVAGIISGL